ncbi:MAG TPA: LysR family transcriptional regulator substrate-binding protein [Pseudonocardiaceae bacterium]|jgi:DNA-binding transcriptional LysR family regulator
MTTWLLVPVLRQWRTRRPEVVLDLSEHTSSDEMAALIAAGGVDLAIGPRPSDTAEHVVLLGEEEIVLVAPTSHRFADRSSVPIADLADEPFVHYAPDNGLAAWLDEVAANANVVLDPVLRTRSPRTAVQLAAAGMGVTIAPLSALTPRPAGVVRPLAPALRRDVVVVVASPSDTLAARFVADLIRRALPGQPTN